jgi:hypothetical protein
MSEIKPVHAQPQYFRYILGKGKAIPLQAWTAPEGSWRLRFPDFKTIGT